MNKTIFLFFTAVLFLQSFSIAQSDKKYIERVENILSFKKSNIKTSNDPSKIIDDIIQNLDIKIKQAHKLKRNTDSISLKTTSLLKNFKDFSKNSLIEISVIPLQMEEVSNRIDSITKSNDWRGNLDEIDSLYIKATKRIIQTREELYVLDSTSIKLTNKIISFKKNNNLNTPPEEPTLLNRFVEEYLTVFFDELFIALEKQDKRKEELALKILTEKQTIYNKQQHRFEFINGMLHYNNTLLFKGQKLSDFENKFGKNYIETQKQEGKKYRVTQYKNIPLEIVSQNGIIRTFFIHLIDEDNSLNENYALLSSDLIKLEKYYFNRHIASLTYGLESKISKDLDRDFSIKNNIMDSFLFISYGYSNDIKKDLHQPSFLLYKKNEKELLKISYSEELITKSN